jgi:hypothetical protein
MLQFMSSEVRYKDFRKAIVPKYDSSRQDSFIHWYKLFCATCLQWGLWCPPYESVEQDNIHGSWCLMLPASVRAQDTFMSSLLYGVLSQETVFPVVARNTVQFKVVRQTQEMTQSTRCFASIINASRQHFTPSMKSLANDARNCSAFICVVSRTSWPVNGSPVVV